jgi:acetamidase/formamidase
MIRTSLALILAAASMCAADISGSWIARVNGATLREPQYARVSLTVSGASVTGSWNQLRVEGQITGSNIRLALLQRDGKRAGELAGNAEGSEVTGDGNIEIRGPEGRRAAGKPDPVAWRLTRPPKRSGGPKVWDFEPNEFYSNYSAAIAPVLHVFPGDTIRTSTIDSGGLDAKLMRRSAGGNPETGPFYIEGALPGDTLVVHLNKVRPNRDTARSGARVSLRAVTPAWAINAKYAEGFNSEWKLDRAAGVATLANPTDRLRDYSVPILPMIGCLATAPAAGQSFRSVDLGPFGGNMDYNQMNEGATLLLPVFQPGALFFLGDGHAAMGDAELTGAALETSLDVEFTVELVEGSATAYPRLTNKDYLMSVGVAGSLIDALQVATSQLAEWLAADYHLNDSEIAIVLGTVLKYDVAEMVDPQISVVAKVPKAALARLR